MNKKNVQKKLREIRELLFRLNDNGSIRSGNVTESVEALDEAIRLVGEHRYVGDKPIPLRDRLEIPYGPHGDRLW